MAIDLDQKIKTLQNKLHQTNVELNYYLRIRLERRQELPFGQLLNTRLTTQQLAVLKEVEKGFNNPQVAANLNIGIKTVKYHLTKIYALLNCKNRIELLNMLKLREIENGKIQNVLREQNRPADGSTTAVVAGLYGRQEASSSGVSSAPRALEPTLPIGRK